MNPLTGQHSMYAGPTANRRRPLGTDDEEAAAERERKAASALGVGALSSTLPVSNTSVQPSIPTLYDPGLESAAEAHRKLKTSNAQMLASRNGLLAEEEKKRKALEAQRLNLSAQASQGVNNSRIVY